MTARAPCDGTRRAPAAIGGIVGIVAIPAAIGGIVAGLAAR